ncbi:PREDICTED: uncharacterized protein LOC107880713 [Prunus mume]|uniref:Uncharacterized protein LOC107880713 n=1 Tax=Prunus mume TaxID=102107 RepID=A0ABM1LLL3_PRUMU|nr:PREDICTED: uncharacterized protein LOC107880713 [Prunus mume]
MDDQTNLVRQLINQINLVQNLGLGQPGEERRMDERADRQLDGYQAGRARVSRQGDGQQRDQLAGMSQAPASHTQSMEVKLTIAAMRIMKRGAPLPAHREIFTKENPLQAQSTNKPPRQLRREGRPSQTNEEVNQRCSNREGRQRDRPAMCAEDVEKLVNDRLRDLKTGGNLKDALCKEMDQAISTLFTPEIEQAAPPKRFSTPSFIYFKGDSDPESHLKHFKAQDWFYTLPSWSISSFKELAYVFTKEYTSYRTIKKNPDHLFNLRKKLDESIRDYIKRFKTEKANIVGCDNQIASSTLKKGLPAEHDLHRELTITPSQTLAEVYVTVERYALWDDDRIAEKKSTKQEDQSTKRAGERSDGFDNKNKDKRRSHLQEDAKAGENYTKFTIPIHQILAHVKNKPWVKRPPPLKGDPDKRGTGKYRAFHGTHGQTTNNCFACKAHLEELVRESHCTEFIVKQAIQRIEDRDTAKEPP